MEETIQAYQNLVLRFPEEPRGWYALAYNLELMGRLAEAIPTYEKVLQLEPNHCEVIHRLGNCHYNLGQTQEAARWYKQIQYLEYLPDALTLQARVAELEPLGKRLARRAKPLLRSLSTRISKPSFLSALTAEVLRFPSNLGAIRRYGMGPYLSYLSRHYLNDSNYLFKRLPCDLCGSRKAKGIFFDGSRKIIACGKCGFETEERKPPEGRDVFNGTYEKMDTIEGFEPIWKDPFIMQIRIKRLKELFHQAGVPFPLPAGSRLVEVGCGQGTTLHEFTKIGMEGIGTETSQQLADYARREYGLDVRHTTIQTARFEPFSYDLFISFHVLEHLDRPSEMFIQARSALKPSGLLMLELPIPELQSMSRDAQYDPIFGYCNHAHVNFFTSPIVREYYSRFGFELIGTYEYFCGQHLMGGFLGRKRPD